MVIARNPQEETYLEVLRTLRTEEQNLLIDRLKALSEQPAPRDSALDALIGQPLAPAEKVKLEIETLTQYFHYRRHLLACALTASQVAKRLGTSRQTPHDRVKARTLLGVLDNGVVKFPSWQFDPASSEGVIPGLPDVLKALQVSDFAKLSWLTHPQPVFEGQTPIERLKAGDVDRVVQEARAVGVV
ncbi:MAG: DUF2384 domain-containing protein [Gloeomargaritaceae cyanobacterium C42_A2020_066]|nr:DUF2384 domain-containing protein [Gloeomargaritaceae cyanobacterium C42_A2020_066]